MYTDDFKDGDRVASSVVFGEQDASTKLKAGFEFNHAGYKEIHPNRYQNVQCDFIHRPKNIKN
jgi:hypothetical protein